MEQTFNVDEYVAQEQLFFGFDEVRGSDGMQYADIPNSEVYQHLQYGAESDGRLSSSPDFILYQSQLPSVNVPESPDRFHYGNTAPFFQSPHQSFPIGFNEPSSSAIDFAAAWNSPPIPQTSPRHTLSSPVDIPTRAHQGQHDLLSPTSTVETSFFSNGSWNSSYTSMSQTESVSGSVASLDTAIEEPMQFPKQPVVMSDLSKSPFDVIEYRVDDSTHRLTPAITPSGKRPRGRRGPLNHAQRMRTAHMRNVKACASCRARKAKCDPGIPCRQCISYYKVNLIHYPCRGQQLEDIADKVLKGHVFPRKRTLGTDLGANFQTFGEFTVYLSFGFGEPFTWPAQIASPYTSEKFPIKLHHKHVVYKWPVHHMSSSERTIEKQWVFPALLMDQANLKAAVDRHLTRLIDEKENFARFPNYNSPLAVLKDIYTFYRNLDESINEKSAKQLLGQAFKLLNLVHIGGDIRISPSSDSRQVLDLFFAPHIRESDVVPCYIRSQLGEVFSKLAAEYMKEVLSKLEVECLHKNCSKFALIVSTFIVVFMSIESVQHKTQKDPFHSVQDCTMTAASTSTPGDDIDGMVDLLDFYKNCFGSCHRDQLLSTVDMDRYWTSNGTSSSFRAGEQFVAQLREGIQRAKPYLMERSKESLTTSDITVCFDRLVARLLLLET